VRGNGVDAVISLDLLTGSHGNMSPALLKEVISWVKEHRDELMEEWKKWHP